MKNGQALRHQAFLYTLTQVITPYLRHVTNSLGSTAIMSTNMDNQAYPTSLCSSFQPGPIQGFDIESGTTYPKCPLPSVSPLSQRA